jgi:ubiquitin carboxyl-terminal hydrolase 34
LDFFLQLADGLANEAEKALTSLLCYNMERLIRMKFIEGCLDNVAKNDSVALSLRLLPKLFSSFHNFRGMDTHEVSLYAEKKHSMTRLFFDNLQEYTRCASCFIFHILRLLNMLQKKVINLPLSFI